MSPNAEAFIAANKKHAVIYGHATGKGGEGAYYELEDHSGFLLTVEECREIGHPRWKIGNDA